MHELGRICGAEGVLPKSCILSGSLLVVGPQSAAGRMYEETFGGSKVRARRIGFHPGGGSQKVKEVRPRYHVFFFRSKAQNNRQTFYQAVAVWKHLAHQNIAPILGVTTNPLLLVSVWMSDEDLMGCITNRPEVDRFSLVGILSVEFSGELTPSPVI